ncbi:MAG: hypothetical protein HYW56_00300 [Candidatus Harrisonbacteria bacterium]|nr:hypothetical protein [Candidatus Harrisonbacteria bacterium]
MNLAAWCFISVDEISACELWTYFPVMGKGALVSQRSKYAQSRDRFKKPGVARGRGK